jgi:hypothetical protein
MRWSAIGWGVLVTFDHSFRGRFVETQSPLMDRAIAGEKDGR